MAKPKFFSDALWIALFLLVSFGSYVTHIG
jgi:hypothetical protein